MLINKETSRIKHVQRKQQLLMGVKSNINNIFRKYYLQLTNK